MDKCPCSKCITYAICHRSPSVKTLIDKCNMVNEYITSVYRAKKVIRVINPLWYAKPQDGEPTFLEGASNILCHSIQIKQAREREK